MNLETITFSPIGQGGDWISIGFGIITTLGVLVLLYQFHSKRKPKPSEISSSPIIGLVALATLLAGAAFLYSVKSNDQLGTVELSPTHLRTPFGTCKLSDIKSATIYPFPQPNSNVPKETYFIFEEINGHQHPLSSKSYNIKAIEEAWLKFSKGKSSFLFLSKF